MANIVKRIVDASERLLYGATAEEAVQRRLTLIDQRVDAALTRMFDALNDDESEEPAEDDARS